MFFCTGFGGGQNRQKFLHFCVILHVLIMCTWVVFCVKKLSYWHMLCCSLFARHAQKKASADADAHNKSYDKAKSSFSVSFAFCKMYETLGSHPFFWRRFKILSILHSKMRYFIPEFPFLFFHP